MGNLLFSPSGRIGPSKFLKGAIILIVLGALLSLPAILGLPDIVGTIAGLISFLLLWCWIALWIKRYHDGGKSGWMSLVPILAYVVLTLIVMGAIMGGSFMELMNASMNGADPETIKELEAAMTAETGLPVTIASIVISLVVAFLFNKLIKQDMHDNQFGPHLSTGETFT